MLDSLETTQAKLTRLRKRAFGAAICLLVSASASADVLNRPEPQQPDSQQRDAGQTATTADFELAAYQALPAQRAIAALRRQGQPDRHLTVSGQANELQASMGVMQTCSAEARLEPDRASCELIWLNDEPVTTGSAIAAGVEPGAHPLYLWRYRRGESTVYLAGTIHLLKSSLYPLPAPLNAAFEASDRVVVEINTAAVPPEQLQFKSMQFGALAAGQTLTELLGPELAQRTDEALQRYGMSMLHVDRLKPMLVATQLTTLRMMSLGYLPDMGMESSFLGRAGERTIGELETIDFQLNVLFGAPLAVQIESLTQTLDELPNLDSMMVDMMRAWLSGDDDTFIEMFAGTEDTSEAFQAWTRELIDERNKGMAEKVAGYLAEDGTTFVLVGSGHLAGDASIVKLLAARGIHGERLSSSASP